MSVTIFSPMQFLSLISDSILFWLKIFIPLLFLIRVAKFKPAFLNMQVAIIALGITLLFATLCYVIYVINLLFNLALASFSGIEQEQYYTTITRAIGPYWFAYWLPFFITIILPQIMWLKKVRENVKSLYVWLCLSVMFPLFEFYTMVYISRERDYLPSNVGSVWVNYQMFPPLLKCVQTLFVFLTILVAIYTLVLKRKTTGKPAGS